MGSNLPNIWIQWFGLGFEGMSDSPLDTPSTLVTRFPEVVEEREWKREVREEGENQWVVGNKSYFTIP